MQGGGGAAAAQFSQDQDEAPAAELGTLETSEPGAAYQALMGQLLRRTKGQVSRVLRQRQREELGDSEEEEEDNDTHNQGATRGSTGGDQSDDDGEVTGSGGSSASEDGSENEDLAEQVRVVRLACLLVWG
jgi:hypothetical protein